eukprot:6509038-Alexandrium_andersonii.AAC.1
MSKSVAEATRGSCANSWNTTQLRSHCSSNCGICSAAGEPFMQTMLVARAEAMSPWPVNSFASAQAHGQSRI